MAYFNNAFKKAFLLKDLKVAANAATWTGAGAAGFTTDAFVGFDANAVNPGNAGFYFAQASFYANDKLGDGTNPHGGYKETTKSKMMKLKHINNMWITTAIDEQVYKYTVEIKPTAASMSCFPCGEDPILRIDVKGAAALRLLNHNAYASLSGTLPALQDGQIHADGSGTVTHPTNGIDMCCVTQDPTTNIGIAPSIVAANWRDQFNNDPILSKLGTCKLEVNIAAAGWTTPTDAQENMIYQGGAKGVQPAFIGASTTGNWAINDTYRLTFEMKSSCELQTVFGCSFDTRDYYLMGDLKVEAQLQDEAGSNCVACQNYVIGAVAQDFRQRRNSAETVIRDVLMTENYRQSPFQQGARDSFRKREIEGSDAIITAIGRDDVGATCEGEYIGYHILHSVPRFNNPSGMFDNDQYLYTIWVHHDFGALAAWETDFSTLAFNSGIFKGANAAAVLTELKTIGGTYS